MTYKTKVFVYGTLKKGNGNHNLEGHPHFYERELIDCFIPISANIRGQDIVEEKAWLYFLKDYDTTAIRKLPTGVW